MWWLEHGVAPHVADEIPWRRKHWIGVVMQERDAAREEREHFAELEQKNAEKVRAMGGRP